MHSLTTNEHGQHIATLQCQNGFILEARIWEEPPDSLIESLEPEPDLSTKTINWAVAGKRRFLISMLKLTTPSGVFEGERIWVALIRSGMVPKVNPSVADQLEICIHAQKQLDAEIEAAEQKYRATVAAFTIECSRNSEYWREVPGFSGIQFSD